MEKTKEMKNKPFAEAIKSYLDRRVSEDKMFAESYADPKKSIAECCDFIVSEVKRQSRTVMTDDEVYGLAVHYYDEADPGRIDKGILSRAAIVIPGDDKERLMAEAIKEYKRQCIEEIENKENKLSAISASKRKEDKAELPTLF